MLHYEYRFSGSGGQGLMLLGDIMAQAAGCLEGKQILLTKSYGPEARGGACRSEMILSDEPINYPAVTSPDLMLAMSQKACDSYRGDLHEGRILLLDEELVHSVPELAGVRIVRIPLTRLAVLSTGKSVAANVTALGAIAGLCRCVKPESVLKAVQDRFAPKFRESNDRAFAAWLKAARDAFGVNK